jgi:hypothetical protein
MTLLNAVVWTIFVRALRHSKSTLAPTIVSSAVNYACSVSWSAPHRTERS